MSSPATLPAHSRNRRRSISTRLTEHALLIPQGLLALSSGYLLALLLAARGAMRAIPRVSAEQSQPVLRLVVLIPAHDEQSGLEATLMSLAACEYPSENRRTVVIADNCHDRTTECAREAGAEVWERIAPEEPGKGFAVAWALRRLYSCDDAFDAVVMLDADCLVSPNLLRAIEVRIRFGASAVQVSYVVDNPDVSHASAMRFAAFALMDTVRPMGKQHLGLSCGLFGTGMAFTRDLLEREPWTATGLVEDGEYHMQLVDAGERAEFAPEAWVSSAMPVSLSKSSDQQARWEQGKVQLIRRWSPRLVRSGLAHSDIVRVHAGLEPLGPPQSLISAGSAGAVIAGALLGSRRLLALSLGTLAAQIVFVFGGLRVVRAPAQVYRALLSAPVLVAYKLVLYARLLTGRGPKSWIRTTRS
jgi:1,2-diacylglycerol 3-beta-glucosyltransferase